MYVCIYAFITVFLRTLLVWLNVFDGIILEDLLEDLLAPAVMHFLELSRLLSFLLAYSLARACAHPLIFSISRFPPSLAISVALLCAALSFWSPSISLWPSLCTGKIAACQVRYYWKVCDCQHGKVRSPRSLTHTCLPRTNTNQSVEHIL